MTHRLMKEAVGAVQLLSGRLLRAVAQGEVSLDDVAVGEWIRRQPKHPEHRGGRPPTAATPTGGW